MRITRVLPLFFVTYVGSATASEGASQIEPAAVAMGPFQFVPSAEVVHGHTDNLFSQPTDTEDSNYTKLKPLLQWVAQTDANTFGATYQGDYGVFHSSSDDNYQDHDLSFDAYLEMNSRNRFDLGARAQKKHDRRGTGTSEGGAALTRDEPDEYDQNSLFGQWDFGAQGALFGSRLTVSSLDVEYQNNRIETQFRDRDEFTVAGRLYARISPMTRLFFELRDSAIEYDTLPLNGRSLDSDLRSYSVGAEWDITGRTTGSAKIGRGEKDFDDATREDGDLNEWEVSVTYDLRSYSQLHFISSKGFNETNGTGSFIDKEYYTVLWDHQWNDAWFTNASFTIGEDNFEDSTRVDDIIGYSAGVTWKIDRWASLAVDYNYFDKNSNDAIFDYDTRTLDLTLNISL